MNVIAKRTLRAFWATEVQARAPLEAWFRLVEKADWRTPADVKAMFRSADFLADNRVIFDIGGNKYRIVAHIAYPYGRVLIKFVGTHRQYDAIDPEHV